MFLGFVDVHTTNEDIEMIKATSLSQPRINFSLSNAVRSSMVNTLERTPMADSINFCGKCKEKSLPVELKEIFDNKVFDFKKLDGTDFRGTIQEYLESSIMRYDDLMIRAAYSGGLIHSTNFESATDILENGLDYSKSSRIQAGPGTYFAGFQDSNYGSCALSATYMGDMKEMPVFEPQFYDAIMENEELKAIARKFAPTEKESYKLTNKYCHDILVDKMGVDVLYCNMGMDSCFVVLNDDKFELRPYNYKIVNGRPRYL